MEVKDNFISFKNKWGNEYSAEVVGNRSERFFKIVIDKGDEYETTLNAKLPEELDNTYKNTLVFSKKVLLDWVFRNNFYNVGYDIEKAIFDMIKYDDIDYKHIGSSEDPDFFGENFVIISTDGTREQLIIFEDGEIEEVFKDEATEEEQECMRDFQRYLNILQEVLEDNIDRKLKNKKTAQSIWGEVYEEYNLDPKGEYHYDHYTHDITDRDTGEVLVESNKKLYEKFANNIAEEMANKAVFDMVYNIMKAKEKENMDKIAEMEEKYGREISKIDGKTGEIIFKEEDDA